MKIIKSIYNWCTATRLRKILSSILAILTVMTSIRFIFLKPKEVKAADIYLGLNEGYGTSASDTNSTITASTITNAVWRTEDLCKVEKCLYFDGTGDYVSHTDDANLDMASGNTVTVEGWFRTPDITSGTRTLISKEEATGADGGYRIEMDSSGFIRFGIDNDNTSFPSDSVTSTLAYEDNKWHHFAAVKDGSSSITLYIDAVAVGTPDVSPAADVSNDDTFYIGIYNGSSNGWSGFIDEVKVMRTARTATEIKADFTGETPSRGTSASFGPDQSYISSGLIGYWKMDETSGNASDLSGNGYTLTNNGTTPFTAGKFGNASGIYNGSSRYFSTATTIPGVLTVSFWAYPASTTNNFFNLASGKYLTSSSGTLTATGFTNPTIFVNGVQSSTVTANTWQLITITDTASISSSAFEIGRANGSYYANNGYIDEFRLYSRTLTLSEVSKLYSWAPGPVGYWKMDENTGTTANDSASNSNTGTLHNTATYRPGKFGSALYLDGNTGGNDTHVQLPDGAFNSLTQGTISLWYNSNLDSSIADWQDFLTMRDNAAGQFLEFAYQISDKTVRWWSDGCGTNPDASFVVPSPSGWHHIAVSVDASGYKMYLDGVQMTSGSNTCFFDDLVGAGAEYLEIGCYDAGAAPTCFGEHYRGYIDDFKVYDYPRTATQIVEDMNGGHPAPGSPVGSAAGFWSFDEGYSTTAYDKSSNANNLTLSTVSWTNDGKFGKAWNGTGSLWVAQGADDADFDFAAADDLSLSFWFKSDSATNPASETQYLLGKGTITNTGTAGYTVYANTSGNIVFGIRDDTTWGASSPTTPSPEDNVTSATDIYDGTWHNIVATKTGTSRLDLYVDGKPNGTPDTSLAASGSLANSIVLRIGDDDSDATNSFAGDIDEVKIYRLALTSDQVKVEYNRGSGQLMGALSTNSTNTAPSWSSQRELCPPGNIEGNCADGQDPSPFQYLPLNENTGTSTVFDISGNARNGTLSNITTGDWVPGKKGTALNFSPDTDDGATLKKIVLADDIYNSLQQGTIEFWFKLPATSADDWVDFLGTNDSGNHSDTELELAYQYTDTTVRIWSGTNSCGGGLRYDASATLPGSLTAWHHLAFSSDGSTTKLYVDGIPLTLSGTVANGCFWGDLQTAYGPIRYRLGCFPAGNGNCLANEMFTGQIDDYIVYSYARTPAQIAWDYNRGKPQGWWKFDEGTGTPSTLYDASGNANNGTSSGSMDSSDWLSGKFNSSLDFDGSDDVAEVSNADPIDLNVGLQNGFTYSAWIYPNTVGETAGRIFQKGTNGSTTDTSTTFCRVEGSTPFDIVCRVDLGTSDANFTYSAAAPANQWTHVAFSWTNDSDDEVTIWINGNPTASSASFSGDTTAEANSMYIAGNGTTTSNTRAFDGQIDDFRVFNYEVTAQQIKTLMTQGSAVDFVR